MTEYASKACAKEEETVYYFLGRCKAQMFIKYSGILDQLPDLIKNEMIKTMEDIYACPKASE